MGRGCAKEKEVVVISAVKATFMFQAAPLVSSYPVVVVVCLCTKCPVPVKEGQGQQTKLMFFFYFSFHFVSFRFVLFLFLLPPAAYGALEDT